MNAENWIAVLPVFFTLIAAVSAGVQRLASLRSRRLDRVASLTSVLVELKSEGPTVLGVFEKERTRLIVALEKVPVLSKLSVVFIFIMGVGTLSVVASSAMTLSPGWIDVAPVFFIVGAIVAVPGVIGGFVIGNR